MAEFILSRTGARFSDSARSAWVSDGRAAPGDFVEILPGGGTQAHQHVSASLDPNGEAILLSTGARLSAEAWRAKVSSGANALTDFGPVGSAAAPASAPAAAPAPEAAPAPALAVAPLYRHTSGLDLSADAANNWLSTGKATSADLTPLNQDGSPFGVSLTPAGSEGGAGAEEVKVAAVLPISADDYVRSDLAAICEALGLDSDGSKAILVGRINAFGDEDATAAAIAAL